MRGKQMAFSLSLCFRDAKEKEDRGGPWLSRSGWRGRGGREEACSQRQEETQLCGRVYCYIWQRWRGQCSACARPCCCRSTRAMCRGISCHSSSILWDDSNLIWLGNEWCAWWGWVMSLGFDNQILSEQNLKRNLKVTFPQSLYKSFFSIIFIWLIPAKPQKRDSVLSANR